MSNSYDLMDYTPPGSSAHLIFQARIFEWLPFPIPGDLPDPGIELGSPTLQAVSCIAGGFFTWLSHQRSFIFLLDLKGGKRSEYQIT